MTFRRCLLGSGDLWKFLHLGPQLAVLADSGGRLVSKNCQQLPGYPEVLSDKIDDENLCF